MVDYVNSNQFSIDAVQFGKPIPQSQGTHRVLISYTHPDGRKTPLNIETPKHFSFGVSPNGPMGEQVTESNVISYTLPLVLFDHRNGPTEEEQNFINAIDMIVEKVKGHCTKEEFNSDIGKFGEDMFTINDFRKLNPIYMKKEKGVVVAGKAPMLYPKLKFKKDQTGGSNHTFSTMFNRNNQAYSVNPNVDIETVDPLSLVGKRMHVKTKLHVESIFVGAKVSIQLRLVQVLYEAVENNQIRILPFVSTSTAPPVQNESQNMNTEVKSSSTPTQNKSEPHSHSESDISLSDDE